jgi:3'-phosphoadenosine 5'-phosphosulfate sulfotransferase (PAPS reductase)/FAD synthetase
MQTANPQPETGALTAREVSALDAQFSTMGSEGVLSWAWSRFGARAAIGTSFQGSGLVMMHIAKEAGFHFPIFTLDTGLLFPETLELHKRLEDFFGWKIESVVPDLTLEQQAESNGPELWKRDPDLCCTIRKVLPLQSKLQDLDTAPTEQLKIVIVGHVDHGKSTFVGRLFQRHRLAAGRQAGAVAKNCRAPRRAL